MVGSIMLGVEEEARGIWACLSGSPPCLCPEISQQTPLPWGHGCQLPLLWDRQALALQERGLQTALWPSLC